MAQAITEKPKRPVDMSNPSINDIIDYEVYCVSRNRFMTEEEKEAKTEQLLNQKTNNANKN